MLTSYICIYVRTYDMDINICAVYIGYIFLNIFIYFGIFFEINTKINIKKFWFIKL